MKSTKIWFVIIILAISFLPVLLGCDGGSDDGGNGGGNGGGNENDPALVGVWHLSTVNDQPILPGVFLTWTITETTITSTSDLDCIEVRNYTTSDGIIIGTSASLSGSECEEGDSVLSIPYTVSNSALTVTITDPEIEPSTNIFVFTRDL